MRDMAAHLDAFEELSQIGEQLPSQLVQAGIVNQAQHVPNTPLSKKIHPVVHPSIWLHHSHLFQTKEIQSLLM